MCNADRHMDRRVKGWGGGGGGGGGGGASAREETEAGRHDLSTNFI